MLSRRANCFDRFHSCREASHTLYGDQFNPMIALKALNYFGDGDLAKLPDEVKRFLGTQAGEVRLIPTVPRLAMQLS